MRHRLPLRAPALCQGLALLGVLLVADPSPLDAQRLAPPLLSRPPVPALPLLPPSRLALDPTLASLRPALDRSGAEDSEKWRFVDVWPMAVEGAVAGALVGGLLGLHGHGAARMRTVASGAGVGALVGGAVGTGMYMLLWLGRPKHATK